MRNWIDQGRLPAVRIGRRVRVRRTDIDRMLADGATVADEPEPSVVAPRDAREELERALKRARRLLERPTPARRPELAVALKELSDSVAATLESLSNDSSEEPG